MTTRPLPRLILFIAVIACACSPAHGQSGFGGVSVNTNGEVTAPTNFWTAPANRLAISNLVALLQFLRTNELPGITLDPGAGYYYGTDTNGVKGFWVLPEGGAGAGDMTQAVYDQDADNVVDDAEALGGQTSAHHLSRANHTGSQLRSTISDFAHASTHQSGGSDAVKIDDLAEGDDNTDLDANTNRHGLMRKLPGGTATFFRADGAFAEPPGGGGGDMLQSVYDQDTDSVVDDAEALGAQLPAYYLARSNHTGTQLRSTIGDFGHASTHQHAGSDEIATATPGANVIPKAGSGGTLAAGFLPGATTSAQGAVVLANSGETTAGEAVQASDARLQVGANTNLLNFLLGLLVDGNTNATFAGSFTVDEFSAAIGVISNTYFPNLSANGFAAFGASTNLQVISGDRGDVTITGLSIAIDPSAVTSNKLAAGNVTVDKIAPSGNTNQVVHGGGAWGPVPAPTLAALSPHSSDTNWVVDFAPTAAFFQDHSGTNDVFILHATNRFGGRGTTWILSANGRDRAITYPSGWITLGAPTLVTNGTHAVLTFLSRGTDAAAVLVSGRWGDEVP